MKIKRNRQTIIICMAFFSCIYVFAQRKIPETTFSSFENGDVSIISLEGKITIFSIFDVANSVEIKKLDKLAEKYNNAVFIAVTDEINDSITNSLKTQLLHYRFLSRKENDRIFNTYQTSRFKIFPIQVLINTNGVVKYVKKGKTNKIEKKLAKRIDKLLKKKH